MGNVSYFEFLAGCIGGAAGVCVGHPFDTVKVRLQVQDSGNVKAYRGTFHCLIKTLQQESALGLYKGLASPIFGVAGINAVIFGVQANSRQLLSNPDSLKSHFLAGGLAGLVQSFICSPTELAKIRIQLSGVGESHSNYLSKPKLYSGSLDCLVQVLRQDGVTGVYRGMNMTIWREIPAFATYFCAYEYLCRKAAETRAVGLPVYLTAGGLAGVASWVVCYPQDVIKSRLQADGVGGVYRYKNALDCLLKSYRLEGGKMFTEGFNCALLRAFPVNAATLATFSVLMKCSENFDASSLVDDMFTSASSVLVPVTVEASDVGAEVYNFGKWDTDITAFNAEQY